MSADPRGTNTPQFAQRFDSNILFNNPARVGHPDYPSVGGAVEDCQMTPTQDSTRTLYSTRWAGKFPRIRAFVLMYSTNGDPANAAVFATDLYSGAVTQLTPTVTTTDTCQTILDLGEFLPPENANITLRFWTSGTGCVFCDGGLFYFRAQVYRSADYADLGNPNISLVAPPGYGPPTLVTQEVECVASEETYFQSILKGIYPYRGRTEFINVAMSGAMEPQVGVGNDTFAWYLQPTLNGNSPTLIEPNHIPPIHFTFNAISYGGLAIDSCVHERGLLADGFGNAAPLDPLYVGPEPYTQDSAAIITSPLDEVGARAMYYNFPGLSGPPNLYQDFLSVCFGIQSLDVVCSGNGRIVSYDGPMPAAIDHYEAVVYYGSGSGGTRLVFKEDLGPISANPFVFPSQPAYSGIADTDGDYFFVIRAYYDDGSYTSAGCPFAPASGGPVFRTRHKAHA